MMATLLLLQRWCGHLLFSKYIPKFSFLLILQGHLQTAVGFATGQYEKVLLWSRAFCSRYPLYSTTPSKSWVFSCKDCACDWGIQWMPKKSWCRIANTFANLIYIKANYWVCSIPSKSFLSVCMWYSCTAFCNPAKNYCSVNLQTGVSGCPV